MRVSCDAVDVYPAQARISVRQGGRLVPIVGHVLRRSATLAGRGMLLEHHAIEASAFPRREVQSHVVYLHTGPRVLAEIEGEAVSGRRWIRPGMVWVMPQGSQHAVLFHSRVEGLSLSYAPARWQAMLASTPSVGARDLQEDRLLQQPQLEHIMRALWLESLAPSEPGLLAAECLATALAHVLLQQPQHGGPADEKAAPGLTGRQLRHVVELVRDQLAEPLPLTAMAAAAGLSVFHFLRAFQRTTGLTPHRYVLEQRMEAAKDLLRQPQRTVAEVGVLVGYAHATHFARAFRQHVGLSPRQFQRSV